MLDLLEKAESLLINDRLLYSLDGWNSLHINYEYPIVNRLWRPWGKNRLYLHKIFPLPTHEDIQPPVKPFFHNHPWPASFKVISGKQKLFMGEKYSDIEDAQCLILGPGSCYEMLEKDQVHSVSPVEGPSLSIMVSGPVWKDQIPSCPPPGKLEPLSLVMADELLYECRKAILKTVTEITIKTDHLHNDKELKNIKDMFNLLDIEPTFIRYESGNEKFNE